MFRKLALVTAMFAAPVVCVAQNADNTGDIAMAERLAKLGQLTLANPNVGDDNFRQSAALLAAACRLNPNEPRYSRLLIEAQLQLKNSDGAIEALNIYLKAQPRDQVARLQLVDLYASKIETTEKRLEYFTKDLLANESLPADFRSAIAVRAARLYLDRDQSTAASEMIDQALALNPINPDACELNWQGLKDSGTPAQKIGALLGMLRANPAQPDVMVELAAQLGSAGLHDQAQQWYTRTLDTTPQMGRPVGKDTMLEAAASSFILGQAKTAESRVGSLIEYDPSIFDAHLIRMMCARRLGGQEVAAKASEGAVDALVNRINSIHKEIAGQESPTTKPSGELAERIPDPAADVAQLKEKNDAGLTNAYAEAMSDLAFVNLYFANKPGDADAAMTALRALLPADSIVLTRLEGLQLAATGKTEEARAKFAKVADSDPISRIGLIRIQAGEDKAAATTAANELLAQHRNGLLGAFICDGLADLDLKIEPPEELRASIDAEVAKFPKDWLDILQKPSQFYSLTAAAPKVPFAFGEPIVVTVTIKNVGNYDIALTSNGTIRPDLWFDCSLRGIQQQQFPGVTFERFGQQLVLHKNETIEHTARVDQGVLWAGMQQNPAMSFPLFFSVFTNPAPSATIAGPGPAGYRFTLRAIERSAVSLNMPQQREAVFRQLSLGDAQSRIRIQEMLAQFMGMMGRQQDAPPEMPMMIQQLREAIEQGMSDNNPRVRAFANYVITQISPEPRRSEMARRTSTSSDWLQRMLLVATTETLTPELKQELLAKMSQDEDPLVRQLAQATIDFAARVPAPASQPSTDAPAPVPDATTPPAAPGN